jgi:hypothetical protein
MAEKPSENSEENPVSWLLVEPGWRVEGRGGAELGTVAEVLGDPELDIFSGVAVSTGLLSATRVVDAAAVSEIRDGLVVLDLDEDELERLERYDV